MQGESNETKNDVRFFEYGLSLIVNGQGDVFVDYRPDLYDAIQKHKSSYKPGEDIRKLLVENSDFVPAYSLPYTVNDKNEPIFLKK